MVSPREATTVGLSADRFAGDAASVLMRCVAGGSVGAGHLKRCLALAAELQALGARVSFALPAPTEPFIGWIGAKGYPLHDAGATSDPAVDAAACMEAAGAVDWLVVDDYALDARWHAAARECGARRIAAIDDLTDRFMAVDLLVDPNERPDAAQRYAHQLTPGTHLLSGVRYALLEPEYRRACRPAATESVRSVGVFMGGGDQLASLRGVLAALRLVFDGPVEVVSTSAQPRLSELRALVASDARMTLSVDLPSLVDFHTRHDLHIGAAGASSWERCCVGAPALAIPVALNQQAVAEALAAHGASDVWSGDPCNDIDGLAGRIASLLANPAQRAALSAAARALVDGGGAERVALCLMSGHLGVRRARPDDAEQVLEWRNDDAVRSVSNSAAAIAPESHRHWFSESLRMANRLLLIGHVGSRKVGVVRFDARGQEGKTVLVSIYLDPALTGLGLGPVLLSQGERALLAAWPSTERIDAEVQAANRRSRSMFHRGGYHGRGATLTKVLRA